MCTAFHKIWMLSKLKWSVFSTVVVSLSCLLYVIAIMCFCAVSNIKQETSSASGGRALPPNRNIYNQTDADEHSSAHTLRPWSWQDINVGRLLGFGDKRFLWLLRFVFNHTRCDHVLINDGRVGNDRLIWRWRHHSDGRIILRDNVSIGCRRRCQRLCRCGDWQLCWLRRLLLGGGGNRLGNTLVLWWRVYMPHTHARLVGI